MFVRDVLDEYYLWYRELPRANPANYPSPQAYLEAVRYRPLDDTFSYITSRAANEAFYGDSQFVGFGFSTQVADQELRVLQVFPESPASESGMARGDRILEVDGRSVGDLIDDGTINSAFGASTPGVTSTILARSRDGEERRSTLTKRVVTIPTVSLTRTFQVDGRTVGYLLFRNFVEPSTAALNEAFAALREAGATVVTGTHVLSGLERAFSASAKVGGGSRSEAVAEALRRVIANGLKVAVECVLIAADQGAVPVDREVVACGGTGSGADTVVVVRPAHTSRFFDCQVREVVAMPRNR